METTSQPENNNPELWSRVADAGEPKEGERVHVKVDGRFVTLFRNKGKVYCIDSICHHAGGPLTLGRLQDIEDLGVTVVLCPWHAFMVTIDGGLKAYQAVSFKNGKAINDGWKLGKTVQRPHKVLEKDGGVYVALQITDERCSSDNDAYSELCAQDYSLQCTTVSNITKEHLG